MAQPKLVRDRIPELLQSLGLVAETRVTSADEYGWRLREKLQEEVAEYLESESAEEIADILEVIDAICEHRGIDRGALDEMKAEKRAARGGFEGRIVLEGTGPA